MLSRRSLLMTGGAAILVAGGYVGTQIFRDAPSVREPWAQAEAGFGDVRLDALAYAILAPNPHNRQPWWVELKGEQDLALFCDLDRRLPETDPPNRQITIGLGAFIELYRMAAAEKGYRAEIEPFPFGEPEPLLDDRPIAHIQLQKDLNVERDPLFEYTLARRTVRAVFDETPVSSETLAELKSSAGLADADLFTTTRSPNEVQSLINICCEGWSIELNKSATHHESNLLTRVGAKEVAANPDGISLYGPQMEAFRMMGLLDKKKMEDPSSRAFSETFKYYNALITSSRAFGWLTSRGNSRKQQLEAGANWVRINLAATKMGLAMHPLSQVLQEFPEMDGPYKELHDLLSIEQPARVQGLFRFGYAKYPQPSPRWPMMSRLATLDA